MYHLPMRTHRLLHCLFPLLLLAAGMVVSAQEEKIFKGVIIDSVEKTPVEKCLVVIKGKEDKDDQTISSEKGHFSLSLKHDSVILRFRHIGYTEKKLVVLFSKIPKGSDTIRLSPANKQMEEIVIKTAVPPIVIKDDTTEFNIDSSMFESYDVVEDLVRRLPGLEIDEEGKMRFQGKPITRILVDGEDLFGGDPTFSMKKLPAGMVAKIQVMDTKTLEQVFNRTPVDGEDKTLNIKLKEGTKTFGSADALAGTKNQAAGSGMLSLFDKAKKLTVMGSMTSSNKIELSKLTSGPRSSFANASTNYGNKWGALRMNGSYAYNEASNSNKVYRERTQLITADTAFFTKSASQSDYKNDGHRFSLNAAWFIDSTSTLDMSLSYSTSQNKGVNSSASAASENGESRNESMNRSISAGQSQNAAATLLWAKRFNRKGRTLTINARGNSSDGETNLINESFNTYFKTGTPVNGDTLQRLTKTTNDIRNYSVSLNYMEPISKSLRLSLRSDLDFNKSFTDRQIHNIDPFTHVAEFDSLYSSEIFSFANTQNLGASLVYNNQKWSISSGLATVLQQAVRILQNETIQQNLLRYTPSTNASYTIAKGKIIRANFSATTIQPTIEQLQPVPDNSNPLYVRVGNPDLKTAFSQTYGLGYSYMDTSGSMIMGLSYAPISNQIVNAVYYDEYRRQTSRYINVDGVYTMRGNFSFSKTRRKEKQFRGWTMSSGIGFGRQVYFQNNNQYYSRNYITNGELSYSLRNQKIRTASYTIALSSSFSRNWTPADEKILNTTRLNIAPKIESSISMAREAIYVTSSYNVWYNKLNYHSSLRKNDEYSIHNFNNNLNVWIKKKFSLQSTLQYQYNTSAPANANKGMFSFNLSTSARVLKEKGLLTFAAFELFSTNRNLRRVVGENYIEDVQMENLQNYFTLKFQYSFSKLERREVRKQ